MFIKSIVFLQKKLIYTLFLSNKSHIFAKKSKLVYFKPYKYTEDKLQQRIVELSKNTYSDRKELLTKLFNSIDYTTLESTDNAEKIDKFCAKAMSFPGIAKKLKVPAICIYSPFIAQAKRILKDSGIRIATVACCFPTGQMPIEVKIKEVEYCVEQGADEVDMVISRGTMLRGDYETVGQEIAAVKKACNGRTLKVILETGDLATIENIRRASIIAIENGADFIKTSTGKSAESATPRAAIIMLDTIKEYHEMTGKKVGFKPAGGMKTIDDAITYLMLTENIIGKEWIQPMLFRLGTSRLADKIIDEFTL